MYTSHAVINGGCIMPINLTLINITFIKLNRRIFVHRRQILKYGSLLPLVSTLWFDKFGRN